MIKLKAKQKTSKKPEEIRKEDKIPGIIYGPEIENQGIEMELKDFEKVYEEAGESSLINLEIDGKKEDFLVLVHDVQYGPLSGRPTHVDFYQPLLKQETEVTIPIVLEGKSPAVKNLDATLVKNISEIDVKALPRNLPQEIKVNVKSLQEFGDVIKVKDLPVPSGVTIDRDPEDIVISVSEPERLEEEEEEEEVPLGEVLKGEEERPAPEGIQEETPPQPQEK